MMAKNRYLFRMYYFGKSKYYGSQRQPNFLTIEDCILEALIKKKYIKNIEDSGFEASSRTDRFVSARAAYFTCILERKPILMEINSVLPREIGVWGYIEVPLDFQSRYNAVLRHYLYIVPIPLYSYQTTQPLNIEVMRKACNKLEGNHDFINFSKRDNDDKNTLRDMDSVDLSINNEYLIFQFKSRAFLRQQVRRMVKKILELGKGEIDYEEFLNLFDPTQYISYQPANPKGLILWDIKFGNEIQIKEDNKSKARMGTYFLKKELTSGFKYQLFRFLQHDDFS
ncbi:MAG: tRNA pseudouridine synthase A [Promethearchaeota archaeon]|jgi:tRNA pseudouridine38-40 synthase